MKRLFAIILAGVITLSLVGCGSGAKYSSEAAPAAGMWTEEAVSEDAYNSDYSNGFYENSASGDFFNSDATTDLGANRPENSKIIYTADLTLYSSTFDDATKALMQLVGEYNGYLENDQLYQYSDESRSANYVIRIPNENFNKFIENMSDSSVYKLVWKSTHSEDITETYYDLENRLESKQAMLKRLNELMQQAESMEDILTIESQIADVEYEIESMTGTKNHYDSLINYSTVNISLEEVRDNVQEMDPGFGQRAVRALEDSWQNFSEGLIDLIIFLLSQIIGIAFLAVVIVLIVVIVKRIKRKKAIKREMQEKLPDEPIQK